MLCRRFCFVALLSAQVTLYGTIFSVNDALCNPSATRTLTDSSATEDGKIETGTTIVGRPQRQLMQANYDSGYSCSTYPYIFIADVYYAPPIAYLCKIKSKSGLCMDPMAKPEEIIYWFQKTNKVTMVIVLKALFAANVPYKVEYDGISFGVVPDEKILPAGVSLKPYLKKKCIVKPPVVTKNPPVILVKPPVVTKKPPVVVPFKPKAVVPVKSKVVPFKPKVVVPVKPKVVPFQPKTVVPMKPKVVPFQPKTVVPMKPKVVPFQPKTVVPMKPKAVPFQPKAVPFQPKAVPFQPKAVPFQPKAVPFQPKAVPFQPKAVPFQPKFP